ncbi:cobalamin synthesis protein [Clostridium bornimense]|uniref:Cobalamin synthesis protein n=1 Tax=Clostridium bornimense TaxID=1216932 RepID=W6S3X9_9CLOT|nr:CobW family GTP-binding protein [Clostridium bornimense]CDM69022.1 cobalamin synthesis protein [Clostridium bornimense]
MGVKVDIVSGFLGAGKTTLIKKIIDDAFKREKVAIIENEFGEVSIDGEILKDRNIDIKEINSGCICCSLSGDFKDSIEDIIDEYNPDRIIVEPSGIAKLSDVLKGCKEIRIKDSITINHIFTVIDISNLDMYKEEFKEFYIDQVMNAKTIIFTRIDKCDDNEIEEAVEEIRKININASIVKVPLDIMDGLDILRIAEKDLNNIQEKKIVKLTSRSKKAAKAVRVGSKIFDSWGEETSKIFNINKIENIFTKIGITKECGNILRGKGFIELDSGRWIEFHYTPRQFQLKAAVKQDKGKIAIIGENIDKDKLELLFR